MIGKVRRACKLSIVRQTKRCQLKLWRNNKFRLEDLKDYVYKLSLSCVRALADIGLSLSSESSRQTQRIEGGCENLFARCCYPRTTTTTTTTSFQSCTAFAAKMLHECFGPNRFDESDFAPTNLYARLVVARLARRASRDCVSDLNPSWQASR